MSLVPQARSRTIWQFGLRGLLVVVTLICAGLVGLNHDLCFVDHQALLVQRRADAFDAGGGYVLSETAIVFTARHRWISGRNKLYGLVLGHAGLGLKDVSGGQLSLLSQRQGSFTVEQSAGSRILVWRHGNTLRRLPLNRGNVFEGPRHPQWEELFDEEGNLQQAAAQPVRISAARWQAFSQDPNVPVWTTDELIKWRVRQATQ